MNGRKLISLPLMRPGQSGRVVQIGGGVGVVNRLNAMGILPGRKVTKVSSMLMRGPVTIQVDRVQVAIGFGMASKVLVEEEQ